MSIIYLYFKKDKILKNYSDPDASNTGGVSKALQLLLGSFDAQHMRYFSLVNAKEIVMCSQTGLRKEATSGRHSVSPTLKSITGKTLWQ